jgi:hypothetical protein
MAGSCCVVRVKLPFYPTSERADTLFNYASTIRSQDSSITLAIKLQAGRSEVDSRKTQEFSLLHSIELGYEAHFVPYTMGAGGYS